MKKLLLQSTSYNYLENAFKEWLDILGFVQATVYNLPTAVREFLYYLEQNNINQINQLNHQHIKDYYNYLISRTNQKQGGALSTNYINHHFWALEKFFEFLHHKGTQNLPEVNLKRLKIQTLEREILTQEEIKELYTKSNTLYKKGHTPWNKGKTGIHTEDQLNNIRDGVRKAMTGVKKSKEHVEKVAIANRGKKRSEETRKKLSESHKGKTSPMKGKKHSIETIEKLKGKKRSKETIEKLKGKKLSNETKQKISKSLKNNIPAIAKTIRNNETGEIYASMKKAQIECKISRKKLISLIKNNKFQIL
jgi:integrase/recombinase XerD